jgi:hypothetical protein
MIVDHLDPLRPFVGPAKADPILVVDTNAVVLLPIAAEGFQAITRRYGKRGQ